MYARPNRGASPCPAADLPCANWHVLETPALIGVALAKIAEIGRGSAARKQTGPATRNRPPQIPEITEMRGPPRGRRGATIRKTMTPLPRDPSQVVAELALDDRRRGVRCVGLAAPHPRPPPPPPATQPQ